MNYSSKRLFNLSISSYEIPHWLAQETTISSISSSRKRIIIITYGFTGSVFSGLEETVLLNKGHNLRVGTLIKKFHRISHFNIKSFNSRISSSVSGSTLSECLVLAQAVTWSVMVPLGAKVRMYLIIGL